MQRLYFLWFLVLCVSAVPLLTVLLVNGDSALDVQQIGHNIAYFTPYARIPEFILGMITGIIFILNSSNNDQSTDDAATSLILIRSDKKREPDTCSSFLRNCCSNYTHRYVFLDIYFIVQIIFFIALHRSPVTGTPKISKYSEIFSYGPFISLISCVNLYMYAKYSSSLTSKLLMTSLFTNMGDISYAFYCLAEAISILASLISGEVEKSLLMRLWAGIGIAVFAHYYIEVPLYTRLNKKIPRCECKSTTEA
ncbi:unnamed protein product [Rotaria sp. Silwood1]|nr:unnamed protein product [Rotaria sp. Silwood1]